MLENLWDLNGECGNFGWMISDSCDGFSTDNARQICVPLICYNQFKNVPGVVYTVWLMIKVFGM